MSSRQRSFIWEFFAKDELGRPFAVCLLCRKEYRTSGNTSNLRDHLNRFHKSEINKSRDESETESEHLSVPSEPKQQKISVFIRKASMYGSTDTKKLRLDTLLGCMVATDFQPYNIVEDTGFRSFVSALDPRYEIPSRNTLSKKIIPTLFNKVTEKLVGVLHNVKYVALTSDMWTSVSGQGYITVTAHFVFNNDLKSAVLETVQIQGHHTSDVIKTHLQVKFII